MDTKAGAAPLRLLKRLTEPFSNLDILVVGDVVLDRCVYTDRVARPRYKQPLLNVLKYEGRYEGKDDRLEAGAAGMIARAARAYGASVRLCGIAGVHDPECTELQALLAKRDIDFHAIDSGANATAIVGRFFARIAMDRYVEHVRVDREASGLVCPRIADQIVDKTRQLIDERRPDALVLGDFARGVICREVAGPLVELARQKDVPIVTLDGKRCWEALEQPLDLAVLSVEEAWNALRDQGRQRWEGLGGGDYPLEWAGPSDYGDFVIALMETFPNVRRFLINDPYARLLAVERDEHLHGEYRYACICAPPLYEVQSPVGSEVMSTVVATLCLARSARSRRHPPDEFFRIGYGVRYVAWVQMGTPAEAIADQQTLAGRLRQQRSFEPIPKGPANFKGPSVWKAVSEREVRLKGCIEKLVGKVSLNNAVTLIPEFYSVHAEFRREVDDGIRELQELLRDRLPKPARLWIHGEPGCGKDFIFEQIADRVLHWPWFVSQPHEREAPDYSLEKIFKKPKGKRACVVINEIDKDFPERMQGNLLTLLDDKRSQYGNLLVIGVASKAEDDLKRALSPDLRRRFLRDREDTVAIEVPSFRERVEDLPYLLVSCMLRFAKGRQLPFAFSKPALELLVRVPDLPRFQGYGEMTFGTLNAAAKKLLSSRAKIVDAGTMAAAFKLRPKERRTIFFHDEGETVTIDTSTPQVAASTRPGKPRSPL